jgi:ABC-type transporter Mla subunit MlaD
MARKGEFSRGGVQYGAPLSFIHPTDNKMPPQWDPALDSVALGLTEVQKQELQDRIDDLMATLRGQGKFL